MAWENVIIGYRIEEFDTHEIIPKDAIFLCHTVKSGTWGHSPYTKLILIYQIPIYKKKNIKRK